MLKKTIDFVSRTVRNLQHILSILSNLRMKQLEKSRVLFSVRNDKTKLFYSSLLNIDNTASLNCINPVNTLVTGEVNVERNEHTPSKIDDFGSDHEYACLSFFSQFEKL